MTTTLYCTPADVAAQLRLVNPDGTRFAFGDSTDPSTQEVTDIITDVCTHIDSFCRDAWRMTPSDLQLLHLGQHYMGWNFWESAIGLRNIGIYELSKAAGDVLNIRNGEEWVDYLDGTHQEGLGLDYWVDYSMGELYLGRQVAFAIPSQIQVQYRYGHPELNGAIPDDIAKAARLLAAAELLTDDFHAIILPNMPPGESNLSRYKTAELWTTKAYDRLSRHQRTYIPSGWTD